MSIYSFSYIFGAAGECIIMEVFLYYSISSVPDVLESTYFLSCSVFVFFFLVSARFRYERAEIGKRDKR